jgi:hypothetical protein
MRRNVVRINYIHSGRALYVHGTRKRIDILRGITKSSFNGVRANINLQLRTSQVISNARSSVGEPAALKAPRTSTISPHFFHSIFSQPEKTSSPHHHGDTMPDA